MGNPWLLEAGRSSGGQGQGGEGGHDIALQLRELLAKGSSRGHGIGSSDWDAQD
jgi:hypothetical protein